MDKILKNPLKPKSKHDGEYPFSFKAPSYDNRTSCSIRAGDDYGMGFRNPTGKITAGGLESGPIPMQSRAFSPDEVMKRDLEG